MKRLLQFMTIGLMLPLILSCSKDNDEEKPGSEIQMIPVEISDIQWTMDNPILWAGNDENGEFAMYVFTNMDNRGYKSVEVGYKSYDRLSFTYIFNAPTITVSYDDGNVERLSVYKAVKDKPTKIYINGIEFIRSSY